MRLVFTSDLHADFGPVNAALVAHLARRAAELAPDVFLLAGDVADRAADVAETLAAFRSVGSLRMFLAGNHDLYAEASPNGLLTSRDKFERVLPRVAAEAGFEYLGIDPIQWRGLAFVGTPGWWDYSLRDPGMDAFVHPGHYRCGAWRGRRAFDRGSILWPRTSDRPPPGALPASLPGDWAGDEEICDHMLALLDDQLRRTTAVRAILGAVHVLPCVEAVERNAFGPSGFHDATLGSAAFGARFLADGRARALVTGHFHRHCDVLLGALRVVSRPVGHRRDPAIDLAALAASCLGRLDVD
jgi:hypothetical protein